MAARGAPTGWGNHSFRTGSIDQNPEAEPER
jgi:hypothetical protein